MTARFTELTANHVARRAHTQTESPIQAESHAATANPIAAWNLHLSSITSTSFVLLLDPEVDLLKFLSCVHADD